MGDSLGSAKDKESVYSGSVFYPFSLVFIPDDTLPRPDPMGKRWNFSLRVHQSEIGPFLFRILLLS